MNNFDLTKYLAEGKLHEADTKSVLRTLIQDLEPFEYEVYAFDAEVDPEDGAQMEEYIASLSDMEVSSEISKLKGINEDKLDEGKLFEENLSSRAEELEMDFMDPRNKFGDEWQEEVSNVLVRKYDGHWENWENENPKELEMLLNKFKNLDEGKLLKENITKLDNYALEIYSDFRKDPSIHFPDVEFEVDEEGFALENDSNYSQLKKYKREIMGLHALFGEESGVKDKNGLQLSMYDVIDNI